MPGAYLTPGDTAHSLVVISPVTGDADTSNNAIATVDTVRSGFDPNHIDVSPEANIYAGTKLQYTIEFENTGNDTAFNIHVMDTLSDDLDISSYRMVAASHTMFLTKLKDGGGHNILRFDFPQINLLDSSHHNLCTGMVVFTINSKSGLPDCEHFYNRAGIYFDDNEVVMTNTANNVIGCWPIVNKVVQHSGTELVIYPNPATNLLHLDNNAINTTYRVMDILGTTILQGKLQQGNNNISLAGLPHGLYLVELTDTDGNRIVRKIVKE